MEFKKCSNCKVEKPFSEFTKHSKTKDKYVVIVEFVTIQKPYNIIRIIVRNIINIIKKKEQTMNLLDLLRIYGQDYTQPFSIKSLEKIPQLKSY